MFFMKQCNYVFEWRGMLSDQYVKENLYKSGDVYSKR